MKHRSMHRTAVLSLVLSSLVLTTGMANPRSPEDLFKAYSDRVRAFDAPGILRLCDDETREVWFFLMGDQDPEKVPKYAKIERLPEVLRKWRLSAQRHFKKIPPDVTDPTRRLELALLERMKVAGEDFCRNFDGVFESAEEVPFIVEAPKGTRDLTFHCGPRKAPFSFCIVPDSGGWKISHYYSLVSIAYGRRVIPHFGR